MARNLSPSDRCSDFQEELDYKSELLFTHRSLPIPAMSKVVLVRHISWIHLYHSQELLYLYFRLTYCQCVGYRRFWIPCFSDHISAPFAAPPCSGVIQVRMISLIKMAFKHYCINRTARVGNSRHSEFIQGPPCN